MKVIIGFSAETKIFARAIKWSTHSKVSHSYIRFPFTKNNAIVIQASGLNVNAVAYTAFLKKHHVFKEFEIEIAEDDYQNGLDFLVNQLGKPYSAAEILGFCWVLLAKAFKKKIHNPFNDGNSAWVCSTLVASFLGLPNPKDETPEDLMEIVLNLPTASLLP